MKKSTLITLILLVVGICLALAGFAAGGTKGFWIGNDGFHLSSADNGKIVTVDETYDSFKNIDADASFMDNITIKEGDSYRIQGQNYERFGGIRVQLEGDTLVVKAGKRADDREGWIINFGIDEWFGGGKKYQENCWIEITYPGGADLGTVNTTIDAGSTIVNGLSCETLKVKDDFGKVDITAVSCSDMDIRANAGDINVSDITASGSVTVTDDFGKVDITSVSCGDMDVKANAGDVKVSTVDASGEVIVNNDFGKVTIDKTVANKMSLSLSAGDLRASDVESGDMDVKSDFGLVSINGLKFSGLCEIQNDSGDVDIELLMSEDDVSYELTAEAGNVSVNGRKSGSTTTNRASSSGNNLKIDVDLGVVKVEFAG